MLTSKLLREMGAEIETALRPLAERYDVTISYEGGKYSDLEATVKLHLTVNADKEALVQASKAATLILGIPADTVGSVFKFRNRSYKVTGISLNRPRFPISASRLPDGKGFKFPAAAVMPSRMWIPAKGAEK